MKARLSIHSLSALLLFAAASARAQLEMPPPTANPDSRTFVETISVSLESGGLVGALGAPIVFDTVDINSNAPWDSSTALPYSSPIKITSSKRLRAQSYIEAAGIKSYGKLGTYRYVLDRPPRVSLKTPVDSAIFRRETAYPLIAEASDPDMEAVTVTFQSKASGNTSTWIDIDTVYAAPYTVSWTPKASSAYRLRALAADPHEAKSFSAEVPITVTEPNMPPQNVVLTAPAEGASFAIDQEILMSATASDPDGLGGGISKVEFYHEDTLIGAANAGTFSATWRGGTAGTHLLQAKAYDNHTPPASAVSATVRITIRAPNARPTVTALTATPPGPLVALAATTLKATAADADGRVARVAFFDNGALLGQDAASPYEWQAAGLRAGNHAFTARAYDDVGDSSALATVAVEVATNQAPVAKAGTDTIVILPVNTVALNGAASSDPEGAGLVYRWSGPSGVTFSNPAVPNPTATFANTGSYTLALTVTDRNTPPDSATDQVVVSLHARPAVTGKLADTATIGTSYTYALAATGFPAPTFTVGALPAGITRTGNVLSGTPGGPGGNAAIAITASNSAGSDSRTLTLTVRQAPAITQNLVEAYAVQERSRVTLTIAASGYPPPAYQWQKVPAAGNPIVVGGNSSTLVLDTVSLTTAGNYRVVVSNGVGTPAISKVCRLDVAAMIRIGSQPLPIAAMAGHPAAFKVGATGAPPLLYQWFRGNTSLGAPAAKDSNLVFNAVTLADNGVYRVRITNSWNDSTKGLWSDTARLTVTLPRIDKPKASPAAPANYGQNGENLVLTLSTDTPSTIIRYTTDGSIPDSNTGIPYVPTAKPTFSGVTVNLRAKAFRTGYQESDLFTGIYTHVRPNLTAKPTAYPLSPVFLSTQTVNCTLTTEPGNAVIRYTLNGANPKTAAYQTYTAPFPLTKSLVVTAYAVGPSGWTDSDTLIKTYTLEVPKLRAQPPTATPKGQNFTGQIQVSLAAVPDSAAIQYTLDGSSPETSPTRKVFEKSKPILITARTVLKAQTISGGQLPSEILTETYVLVPGPITATPPLEDGNHVFDESVVVRLAVTPDVPIYYTLNDSLPLDGQNRPVAEAFPYSSGGIPLQATSTVTAMALADGSVPSAPFRFRYTKRGGALNTPLVSTSSGAYTFKDSLRVNLTSTPGSTIRYTRDGSLPTAASKVFSGPVTIDTTETFQAVALQSGFEPSRILYATFTLEADTPWASPRGGSYFSSQRVNLFARSRRTPIKYTLDGTTPGPWNGLEYVPGQSLFITAHAELKAVALSGGLPGPLRHESYRINKESDTLLLPGETCFLEGGYSLANPLESSSAVQVKQGSADILDLPGFEHVQFRIVLAPAGTGPARAFPGLVLSRSAAENRGLYKADPDGPIYFVSAAARIVITEPGTYFMGMDAMRPVITFKGERLDDSGYTVVRFLVEDNVRSLLYSTRRSDNPRLNVDYELMSSGSEREFRLRNGKGVPKSLLFQLSVTDFSNLAYFPPDGRASLPLSQALTDIQSAGIWRVGADAAKPHDLVGIPLNLDPPLKLKNLGDARSGTVEAFIYVEAAQTFRRLRQDDELVPGQAYWLAARAPLPGLSRASAILRGTGSEKFAVKLTRGWNQVANPHLDTLYWPVGKSQGAYSSESRVKRLWEYNPADTNNPFVEREAMVPWKGYYVYNFAGDTVVQLSGQPPAIPFGPVSKRSVADPYETDLVLSFGDASPVTLAAAPASRDEVGWEDELLLPAFASGHRLQAVRQGTGLSCDWIRFRHDAILRWSVLPRSPEGAAEPPPVRVRRRILPEGYQAWAVSRKRGMKFLLEAGHGLPVSGLPDDTLQVIAGPAAKLAGESLLHGMSEAPPPLGLRVRAAPGGPELLLDLPGRSRVRASLWTLRGASLGELDRNLPAGHYRFRYGEDFRRRVARPAAGVHLLRLEISAPGAKPAYITRKVIFKD